MMLSHIGSVELIFSLDTEYSWGESGGMCLETSPEYPDHYCNMLEIAPVFKSRNMPLGNDVYNYNSTTPVHS